ncbi:MAG TPA: allantoate amidohydrolase [Ktedonobacteraceae bacterium]|nr:allantoate amidohydrolase [Ktedonobacteraceae bacterium]
MQSDAVAHTVMDRCEILSRYSEEPDRLTRRFASPALRQACAAVANWMQAAGMTVQSDAIGNLIGRYEADRTGAKTFLLGSHLDTVRDAGKYDGPLGVLTALACVERLYHQQRRLPFAIEVLAFADEEGLRYHNAYLGSKAMTGTFDPRLLSLIDADGIAMNEAIRASGCNPDPQLLQTPRWQRDELLGYCEVHIEQGPILESRNNPVGVVTAISGQKRFMVDLLGQAGHAGTVPMNLRHDALCAAATFILATEALAKSIPGLVATVGQLSVQPGASNVIPGQVTLSLDVRHQDDVLREQACQQLYEQARQISEERKIRLHWQLLQDDPSVVCTARLVQLLEQAIQQEGYSVDALPSGAGHDTVVLSKLTDVAMLFVRCRGGISHHPAEAVKAEDVAVAIQVLERFLLLLS